MNSATPVVFMAIVLFLALICMLLVALIIRLSRKLSEQESHADERHRKGLAQSRAVLSGQVAEHFAPLLPGFPWSHKDARFLGQPVDYLVFDGLDANADTITLAFVEVKTGTSALNARERKVREAIQNGRVVYCCLRLDDNGELKAE